MHEPELRTFHPSPLSRSRERGRGVRVQSPSSTSRTLAARSRPVNGFLSRGALSCARLVISGDTGGIAGGEEDLHAGPVVAELLRQLDAAHAAHQDVGHHEMDRPGMPLADVQGLLRVGGFQHVVAVRLEDLEERPPHVLLVLDEQDRLPGALARDPVLRLVHRLRARQEDDEARALARSLSATMCPPLWVTIPYVVERPRPLISVPCLVVKNGSKTRRRTSSAMPGPLSVTWSCT